MAGLPLIVKYILVFLVSMIPIVELRGAIPIAEGLGLNIFIYYPLAIIGNMFFCPFFIFYLNFLYCTIKGVNCLEENCLSLCIFLKVFKYLA